MNLDRQPQSANFEDRTGWSDRQRRLNALATILNPMLAAANLHEWMKAHGYAPINGVNLRRNVLGNLSNNSPGRG